MKSYLLRGATKVHSRTSDKIVLSTLWLEAWTLLNTRVKTKTILFDIYYLETPILRWYLESIDNNLFCVLLFKPGKVLQRTLDLLLL